MVDLIDIFLHMDKYLGAVIQDYGIYVYLLLFLIIFIETGIVIAPFLPGDSLIFLTGAFASLGLLDPLTLFIVMTTAAITGDSLNYFIGHHFARRGLHTKVPYVKQEHIDRTYAFYQKHGGKTIVIARFVPFLRSLAPFVAGIVKMRYSYFILYNVAGGIFWVASFIALGYFFGSIPIVKENLWTAVIPGLILISLLPAIIGYLKQKR